MAVVLAPQVHFKITSSKMGRDDRQKVNQTQSHRQNNPLRNRLTGVHNIAKRDKMVHSRMIYINLHTELRKSIMTLHGILSVKLLPS
jgi:hypothetical protein